MCVCVCVCACVCTCVCDWVPFYVTVYKVDLLNYYSVHHSILLSQFASFPAPTPDPLSKTWATPAFSPQKSAPLGVGVGVSMNILTEGWGIKLSDKRRHVMEFNTLDRNKTGYLSGIYCVHVSLWHFSIHPCVY